MGTTMLWVLISGISSYAGNVVAFYALSEVHPITHAVGNALKRVVVLLAAVIFLGEFLSSQSIIGATIAILGVLAYSVSKNYYAAKKAAALQLENVYGIQASDTAYVTLGVNNEEDQP
jgi:drug/metabolite transporter (DMT)-like permease